MENHGAEYQVVTTSTIARHHRWSFWTRWSPIQSIMIHDTKYCDSQRYKILWYKILRWSTMQNIVIGNDTKYYDTKYCNSQWYKISHNTIENCLMCWAEYPPTEKLYHETKTSNGYRPVGLIEVLVQWTLWKKVSKCSGNCIRWTLLMNCILCNRSRQ